MTRIQLTDSEWEFIGPYLPIGQYCPCPERLRQQYAEADPEREEQRRIRRRRKLRLKAALLGRSRGGQTSEVHLAADRNYRPPAFVLTEGQAADSPQFMRCSTRSGFAGPLAVPAPGLPPSPETGPTRPAGEKHLRAPDQQAQGLAFTSPAPPIDHDSIRALADPRTREQRTEERDLIQTLRTWFGGRQTPRDVPPDTGSTRYVLFEVGETHKRPELERTIEQAWDGIGDWRA